MTPKITDLTDEQINVLIAEYVGWRDCYVDPTDTVRGISPNGGSPIYIVPSFCSDLNAMHEAEKTLTREQCFIYRDLLQAAVLKEVAEASTDFVFGATAKQRACAFLLATGKAVA